MMSVSSEDPMLSVGEVVSGYGDLTVLNGISLDVPRGTVEVILGRNGVGKTTLLSSIAGLVPLDSGEVFCDGQAIGRRASYRRAAAGVALVQEGKRIFRGMSVMDNVLLGAFTRKVRRSERQARCLELLDQFPMLHDRLHQSAGSLSGGQQQMLAIAQALASEPRVLLLDEPSAGLAPTIVADVFARVRALRDDGLTIVLVEQLAEQALAIADHVTVIDDGRVVQSGPPEAFDDLQALHEAYFGAPAAAGA